MLEYDRIDLSEGIDVNKCEDTSKKCSLCQYYYFVFINFNYQRYLCDGCYDMSVKALCMQHLLLFIIIDTLIMLILCLRVKIMLLI